MSTSARALARGLGACALLLFSVAASAHGDVRGVKGFYAGALHPFLAPAHFMALAALGLFIGQRGLTAGRDAILVFVLGLAAGLLVAGALAYPDTDKLLLGLAALIGLVIASALSVPAVMLAVVGAMSGLAVGIGSAPENLQGNAWWIMAGGSFISAFLCVMLIVIGTEPLRRAWMRIGIRVVGSWLTASALLVLALSIAPRHAATLAHEAADTRKPSDVSQRMERMAQ